MNVNAAPIGALAIARISLSLMRQTSAMNALIAMKPYAKRPIHAHGT